MIVFSIAELASPYYLQYWSLKEEDNRNAFKFTSVMLLILAINFAASCLRNHLILFANLKIAQKISFVMAFRLVHASINEFFDRVPIGRILNRFLRDLNEIDLQLGFATSMFTYVVCACMIDFIVSIYASSPIMIIFIGFYFWYSFKLQRRYMCLNREATRLRSISSSPMIQAFSEGLSGASVIRVYGQHEHASIQYIKTIDDFQKNTVLATALQRWFNIRMVIFSLSLLIPSILMNILVVRSSPGIFALLMRYMLVIMSDIQEFLNVTANQENRLISFERCSFFANISPEKGYRNLDVLEDRMFKGLEPIYPKGDWPRTGDVEVQNLKIRYRTGLPLVIKGITLKFESGTKIGIVGRTGAGKTTFLSALYRHFDDYEGDIFIDGMEVRDIDLKVLRSGITVIPQDPYLFQDTVRNNLDPLGRKTDIEIESILRDIDLWSKFEKDGGLQAQIDQSGSNLSQGQKQLLCLSRALLYRNKVILMDEATANIDSQSELIIQNLLKIRFKDCTIFMIAHRLNTILHCDKVLVLDQGLVLEYGNLEVLKNDKKSKFAGMLAKYDEMNQALS